MTQKSTEEILTLSDHAIAEICKCLQMAILTGTDVVDNLRIFKLVADGSQLVPSSDYLEDFQKNVEAMQRVAENQASSSGTQQASDDSLFDDTNANRDNENDR